ncbi:MAG: DEAD/DEAH box helicase [Candidatus Saccharimonadales bacterium]
MQYNSTSRGGTRYRGGNQRNRSGGGGNRRRAPQKGRGNQGQYIHPDKFVNKMPVADQPVFTATHSFSDFGLFPALEQTLQKRGYSSPTAIQDEAILPAMDGQDVIGIANTGTGKTAAFVLPIIHRLKTGQADGQVLIIAPTRELAGQIDEEFRSFSQGLNLYSVVCVGGMRIDPQIRALQRRPQVVIGTPGRLKDLLQQRKLHLDSTGILVLDEADRMLDMGFLPDIRFLLDRLPTKRQSLCFSATITPTIKDLMDRMMNDPVSVSVRTGDTSRQVAQDIVRTTSKEHKLEVLTNLLAQPHFEKVLVFGQTKFGVQRLADTLSQQGTPAQAIHGNKTQSQRQRALKAFKDGHVDILVATDVAARGLDIPNVSHVINFDQPHTYDDYIHRIGRTGRAGKRGEALTFISQ